MAIAVDPFGAMFIVNSADKRILHLSQNSTLRLSGVDRMRPYPDSFDVITDITIGHNGELLVVNSANHNIKSFETMFYVEPAVVDYTPTPKIAENVPFDQTDPVLIPPVSLTVEATDFLTSVSLGNVIATDASGIKDIVNNAPSEFTPSITNIIWITFDYAGYSASAYPDCNSKCVWRATFKL